MISPSLASLRSGEFNRAPAYGQSPSASALNFFGAAGVAACGGDCSRANGGNV